MASNARQAGMVSGLDAILEAGFGVSIKPTVRRVEALAILMLKIEREKIPCQRLRISELPVDRDTLFDMTGKRVPFPETNKHDRCYVALLDPEIAAPWGHSALWAFVPVDGKDDIALLDTEFPENAKGSVRFIEVSR